MVINIQNEHVWDEASAVMTGLDRQEAWGPNKRLFSISALIDWNISGGATSRRNPADESPPLKDFKLQQTEERDYGKVTWRWMMGKKRHGVVLLMLLYVLYCPTAKRVISFKLKQDRCLISVWLSK